MLFGLGAGLDDHRAPFGEWFPRAVLVRRANGKPLPVFACQALELHDEIMRSMLKKYRGYEASSLRSLC